MPRSSPRRAFDAHSKKRRRGLGLLQLRNEIFEAIVADASEVKGIADL